MWPASRTGLTAGHLVAGELQGPRPGEDAHAGQPEPLAPAKLAALEAGLRGLPPDGGLGELAVAFEVACSLPHGHVAAALGTLRLLGLPELLDSAPSRQCDLAVALVVA